MTIVDNRAVKMEFDNQGFEKGVGQSIHSLDALKKSLDMTDAVERFSVIDKIGKSLNLSGIEQSLSTIQSRLSAGGAMLFTMIQGLTNAALVAGQRIIDNLITRPLREGYSEYELLMGSIQTIMANTSSKGTTLDDVNKALRELNEYSDRTIYNFGQMTANIGRFTAAGIDLKVSVAAIKGISNLAAVSGSSAEQASMAMYQLSQALASGTVKLIDWNSVVNAGMGGAVFQEALKETARVHKINIDAMIKRQGSFRESLSEGWLTSKILLETLSKFTGDLSAEELKAQGYTAQQIEEIIKLGQTANDAATKVKTVTQLLSTLREAAQSGWSMSWQLIVGDFGQAKGLLTYLNDMFSKMIGDSADTRNKILSDWQELGGRTMLIAALVNAFKALMGYLDPIKRAFRDLFPPVTGQILANMSLGLWKLVQALTLTGDGSKKLYGIFKGLFSYIDIAKMFVVALVQEIAKLGVYAGPILEKVVAFFEKIANFGTDLRQRIIDMGGFPVIFQMIHDKILEVRDNILSFLTELKTKFENLTGIDLSGMSEFADKVRESISKISTVDTSGVTNFFDTIREKIQPFSTLLEVAGKLFGVLWKLAKIGFALAAKYATEAGEAMYKFSSSILDGITKIDPDRIYELINEGLLAAFILAVKNFIDKGSQALGGVSGILDSVGNALQTWQNNLKADTLLKIAAAIGIITLSVIGLSMVDTGKLAAAMGAMTGMFVELIAAMAVLQKIGDSGKTGGIFNVATTILVMATAILILAGAVTMLAKVPAEDLTKGMLVVTMLIVEMIAVSRQLSVESKGMTSAALAMIVLSGALLLMTSVVRKLGEMDTKTVIQGLIAVGALLAEIVMFMKASDMAKTSVSSAVGITLIATAILIMASAVEKLGKIDPAKLTAGMLALTMILVELTAFIQYTQGSSGILKTAAGLMIISGAILILSYALGNLGAMSWEEIGRGLVALGGALLLIFVAVNAMPPNMAMVGASLLIVSAALVVLAHALNTLGSMSWDQLGVALVGLAGAMAILAIAMTAMEAGLPGAAAMIVAAGAIAILTPALKGLGEMSLKEIGIAILALAAAFAVLGLAGYLLTPVVPSLLGLGAATILLGVGLLAAGAGLLMFSAALTAFAGAGAAGAAALVLMVTSFLSLIPMIVKTLGRAVLLLVKTIADGAPILMDALIKLVTALIKGLITLIPLVLDAVELLVIKLLEKIVSLVPKIVEAGYDLIIALLDGIGSHIGDIVTTATTLIVNFCNALAENLPLVVDAGWKLIIAYVDGLTAGVEENLPVLIESVKKLGTAILNGLLEGITGFNIEELKAAIVTVATNLITAFKEFLGINSPSTVFMELASDIINGLVTGLTTFASNAVNAVSTFAGNLSQPLRDKINEFITIGGEFVTNLASGITTGVNNVVTAAVGIKNAVMTEFDNFKNGLIETGGRVVDGLREGIEGAIMDAVAAAQKLAQSVLDAINDIFQIKSPSRATRRSGKFIDQGLANGIEDNAGYIYDSVSSVADGTMNAFSTAFESVGDLVNTDLDMSPTITPVIDLSNVSGGVNDINSMFANQTLPLGNVAFGLSQNAAANQMNGQNGSNIISNNPSYQFVQNNYSPKALSRFDIFRQTQQQINQLKNRGYR